MNDTAGNPSGTLPSLSRGLKLAVALVAAWLLWSGLYKPLLLGLGLFSCVLTLHLTRRMGYFKSDLFALSFSLRLLKFWGWLAKEIVKSSLQVTRVVLDPKLPISPRVVRVEATSENPVDQVILGNGITLTPGTLALDVHEGVIQVHCLTEDGARDVLSGDMDRRVAGLRSK